MKSTKNMPCISVTFTLRSFTPWLERLSEHLSFIGICSAIHLFINPDSCIRCNLNDKAYSVNNWFWIKYEWELSLNHKVTIYQR